MYEPFCANYAKALDIINAEAPNIMVSWWKQARFFVNGH